jgi:hypothetical protein
LVTGSRAGSEVYRVNLHNMIFTFDSDSCSLIRWRWSCRLLRDWYFAIWATVMVCLRHLSCHRPPSICYCRHCECFRRSAGQSAKRKPNHRQHGHHVDKVKISFGSCWCGAGDLPDESEDKTAPPERPLSELTYLRVICFRCANRSTSCCAIN